MLLYLKTVTLFSLSQLGFVRSLFAYYSLFVRFQSEQTANNKFINTV